MTCNFLYREFKIRCMLPVRVSWIRNWQKLEIIINEHILGLLILPFNSLLILFCAILFLFSDVWNIIDFTSKLFIKIRMFYHSIQKEKRVGNFSLFFFREALKLCSIQKKRKKDLLIANQAADVRQTVCRLDGWPVGLSVCHNFLRAREVKLPFSFRRTCLTFEE